MSCVYIISSQIVVVFLNKVWPPFQGEFLYKSKTSTAVPSFGTSPEGAYVEETEVLLGGAWGRSRQYRIKTTGKEGWPYNWSCDYCGSDASNFNTNLNFNLPVDERPRIRKVTKERRETYPPSRWLNYIPSFVQFGRRRSWLKDVNLKPPHKSEAFKLCLEGQIRSARTRTASSTG